MLQKAILVNYIGTHTYDQCMLDFVNLLLCTKLPCVSANKKLLLLLEGFYKICVSMCPFVVSSYCIFM